MTKKLIAAGLLAASANVSAQTPNATEVRKEVRVVTAAPVADTMFFVANEFHFDAKPVPNAPYSAESVTESTQMLTDGNRITRKASTAVYRDGQGRTRREESLPAMGSEPSKKMIFINDSVGKVSYILDPEKKTARKIALGGGASTFTFSNGHQGRSVAAAGVASPTVSQRTSEFVFERRVRQPNGEEAVERKIDAEARAEASKMNLPVLTSSGEMLLKQTMESMNLDTGRRMDSKIDQLGKRTIEGLECTGVKITMTLAVGVIGNERPIDTIQEIWTSAALQTAVQTRRSDPRTGETNFKLTNVVRTEPLKSLFEVPADYKVEEGGGASGFTFSQRVNKD